MGRTENTFPQRGRSDSPKKTSIRCVYTYKVYVRTVLYEYTVYTVMVHPFHFQGVYCTYSLGFYNGKS